MATNDIRIDRLEHGVRLLDSGQKKILDRIDDLSAKHDGLSARVDNLSDKHNELSARVDNLSDKVDNLSDKVDNLSDKVDELADNQVKLAKSVSQLTELTFTVLNELKEVKADIADLKPGSRPTGFIKD